MQITAEDAEQMHAEKSQSFGSSALRPLRILCATLAWSAVKLFVELLKLFRVSDKNSLLGNFALLANILPRSFITLSEKPGIAVEINEEGMKKYAMPGIPFFV